MLLGDHTQPLQNKGNGQGVIKGFAQHKGHGPLGSADQIHIVQGALVVCNHQEWAFLIFDIITNDFQAEYQRRCQPANDLSDPINPAFRSSVSHTHTSSSTKIYLILLNFGKDCKQAIFLPQVAPAFSHKIPVKMRKCLIFPYLCGIVLMIIISKESSVLQPDSEIKENFYGTDTQRRQEVYH